MGQATEVPQKMHATKDTMVGIIIGATAGMITGLLFAPRSGEQTRELLKERANERKEKMKHKAIETADIAKEKAKQITNAAKTKTNELATKTKNATEQGKEEVERIVP